MFSSFLHHFSRIGIKAQMDRMRQEEMVEAAYPQNLMREVTNVRLFMEKGFHCHYTFTLPFPFAIS